MKWLLWQEQCMPENEMDRKSETVVPTSLQRPVSTTTTLTEADTTWYSRTREWDYVFTSLMLGDLPVPYQWQLKMKTLLHEATWSVQLNKLFAMDEIWKYTTKRLIERPYWTESEYLTEKSRQCVDMMGGKEICLNSWREEVEMITTVQYEGMWTRADRSLTTASNHNSINNSTIYPTTVFKQAVQADGRPPLSLVHWGVLPVKQVRKKQNLLLGEMLGPCE